MELSAVIATYNQAERLRLVLAGLTSQTLDRQRFEVLVVDDGSTDGTRQLLEECPMANLRTESLMPNQGRNRARNYGIRAARGELVVFLDGDALPAPDLLQRYLEAYREHGQLGVLCGHQYSIPDLEYFQDPQTGSLADVPVASVTRDYIDAHLEEMVVTEEMIRGDFPAIRARALAGAYPFDELREFQEQVRDLLQHCPDGAVSWLGLIPHNGAVPAALLREAGGFDEEIAFSEGWDLAYRLRGMGAGVFAVPADSYHLYHYHGFADPEAARTEEHLRFQAIEYLVHKHRDPRLRLVHFWLAGLWPDPFIPEEAVIRDTMDLERLYRTLPDQQLQDYHTVLRHHPLRPPLREPDVGA